MRDRFEKVAIVVMIISCILSTGAAWLLPTPFALTNISSSVAEPVMLGTQVTLSSTASGGTAPYNATWVATCDGAEEEDPDWTGFSISICADTIDKQYKINASDSASNFTNKTKTLSLRQPNVVQLEGAGDPSTGTTVKTCIHKFRFRYKETVNGVDTFTDVGPCYYNCVCERIKFKDMGVWEDWGDWQEYCGIGNPLFLWESPRIVDKKQYSIGIDWDELEVGEVLFEYKQEVRLKKKQCGVTDYWPSETFHFKIKKYSSTQVIHELQ